MTFSKIALSITISDSVVNILATAFRAVNWTSDTATAITESTLALRKTKQSKELSEIVELVKNGLTPPVRSTVIALIVIDVHARDVVERLINKGRGVVLLWAGGAKAPPILGSD